MWKRSSGIQREKECPRSQMKSFMREESPMSKAAKGSGDIRTDNWSSGSAMSRSLVILARAMAVEWQEQKFERVQKRVGKFIAVTACSKILPENEKSSVYVC